MMTTRKRKKKTSLSLKMRKPTSPRPKTTKMQMPTAPGPKLLVLKRTGRSRPQNPMRLCLSSPTRMTTIRSNQG